MCPDRHQINLQIDVCQNIPDKIIQTPGCVTVSCYYLPWFWVTIRQVLNSYLAYYLFSVSHKYYCSMPTISLGYLLFFSFFPFSLA